MITAGLVTVTFRKLSPEQVVALAQRAALAALEWGGDVHVPPGDLARARQVGQISADAGLEVAAYGSYYRVGTDEAPRFEAVLETALSLGAPLIRVWAGRLGGREATDAHWARLVDDSQHIAALAAQAGLRVAYEFHGGTLTDTTAGALRLLQAVDHPALGCYWQPPRGSTRAANLAALHSLTPWLAHLHAFHWLGAAEPPGAERRPLAEGEQDWKEYLRLAAGDGKKRCVLLEFVRGDRPEQLPVDAAVLRGWLAALAQ